MARVPFERARTASTTHPHPYLDAYVSDLPSAVDLEAIRDSKVHIGVDPLGGASVAYWDAIGERYGLNLEVVNHTIDPTFRFMTVDWDGQIRMDPSSPYAMARLVGLKDRFDVAFANDPDADRHGIVSHSPGIAQPEPLPLGRDRIPVRQSPRLAGIGRGRQDRGQQQHDRSGGGAA